MTEEAILDDDRKKQRFRKMLEKRKRMPKDSTTTYPSIFSTRPARKKPKFEVKEYNPNAAPERGAGIEAESQQVCIASVNPVSFLNNRRLLS